MPRRRADFGAPIGPYFDELDPVKRVPLLELRAIVEQTVPAATSGLKWGSPFFTLDGRLFCAMGTLKHSVALSIYAPPEVFDDPDGLLEGNSNDYRVLKVRDGDAVPADSVRRWLLAAATAGERTP